MDSLPKTMTPDSTLEAIARAYCTAMGEAPDGLVKSHQIVTINNYQTPGTYYQPRWRSVVGKVREHLAMMEAVREVNDQT